MLPGRGRHRIPYEVVGSFVTTPATVQNCAGCGQPFSEESPFGICPSCVFGQAMPGRESDNESKGLFPCIENYTLLEQIGEGGFAKVYRARETGDFPRTVALKVLKRGMDTERIIERFAIERRALAAMEHPNIATVLGGGESADGRPYFVMELVEGESVIQFAKKHALSLRERLKLFLDICHGVQHAHQKGMIHRDLKPGNILVASVDGNPLPKIIDFGIAKALDRDREGESEAATRVGEWLGTPVYMSPEQLDPDCGTADTRADVYSLGVVMYELLTGTEYQSGVKHPRVDGETVQQLKKNAYRNPSSVVAERSLSSELRGELDWVVEKALAVDPSERYQSVSAMAEDVECYLSGQPVRARPASSLYLIRKAAGRHKKGLAIACAFGFIVCAGGIGVMWQRMNAIQAQQEREAVTVLFKDLREVLENRLGTVDLAKQVSVTIAYYDDLKRSGSLVPTKSVRVFYSDLWMKLGNSYRDQGRSERARMAYARALGEREALLKDFPTDERIVSILSGVYASLAKVSLMELALDEAVNHYHSALKLNRKCLELVPGSRKYENNLAATNTSLGICLHQLGKAEDSRKHFRDAIRIRRRLAQGLSDSSQERDDLSYSLFFYALQSLETGTDVGALAPLADEVLRIRAARSEARPGDLKRMATLGKSKTFSAEVALLNGESRSALSLLKAAEAFWRDLQESEGASYRIEFTNELTRAQIRLAAVALANADVESARTALADARQRVEELEMPSFLTLRYHLASAELAMFDEDPMVAEAAIRDADAEIKRLLNAMPEHPLLKTLRSEFENLESLLQQQGKADPAQVDTTPALEPNKDAASHYSPALP